MRVVVPHTPSGLRATTRTDLARFAPHHELHDTSSSDTAYYDAFTSWWLTGETFLVVEHDMGLRADVLPSLEACSNLWCGFTYHIGPPDGGDEVVALGCTRFRAELLQTYPDVPARLAEMQDTLPPRHWLRLDCRLDALLRTLTGRTVCRHNPPLPHYHYEPEPDPQETPPC